MADGDDRRSLAGSGWRSWSPGRRVLVIALVVAAGPVVVDAVSAGLVAVGVRSAPGPLDPRDPSHPGAGVLAGRVAEVPPPGSPQADVVLRFVGGAGRWDVPTRSGDAFSIELPAGSYTVEAVSGQGVCPSRVEVLADGWQRSDVLWPCRGSGDTNGPPPDAPGGPAPGGPGGPPGGPGGPPGGPGGPPPAAPPPPSGAGGD